ncbi:inositol monophosphatase family protein [Geodermatophilus sabuli]|uniref:Inositol-1-monophosphatase n=1 Tax=Geodermatophilus sabuli TaxID=1564158 RepID=A0A285EAT1_9ACTN|nr:inositol monophosphatase family protein [Geodermatophilus sabuli]MBB3085429.1 myo-inositol-1(or 4)-monophosphatase [Geodermatophilus sabuli]SNX96145.1 myo-inositol-1(or 4)-monophosphatase [Geodermatophilus sabuli]
MTPAPDAAALLDLAVTTAREAADLVTRGRASAAAGQVDVKSSPVDMVTAVDKACEELVVTRLLSARPDDGLLGEEGAARTGTSGVRWVVDPIDGTTNFVYGLPAYAVSIAAEVDGQARAGVVLNVATGELYSATAGGGAHLTLPGADPVRLGGSRPASLEQTLVATGFGYRAEQRRAQGAVVAELLPYIRDIRRHGSAALDLCTVAAGRVDAYYELHLNRWDFAAGALVAAEAGVVVTGLPGRAFAEPLGIAAAPSVADEFIALLDRLHPR